MKQAATLALLSSANILVTLLLQWYVVTQLGVGFETDALFASMVLPQLILGVVSNSLTHVLVPLLTTGGKEFRENAWGFFLGISAIFAVVALVLGVSSGYWVHWLFPGFTGAGAALAAKLARIQLASMVLTASVAVLWSVYHAEQKFIWVALSPVLAGIAAFFLMTQTLPRFGVAAAAWAMVGRTALQLVLLLPGLGPPKQPRWRSPAMRAAWARLMPLLLGASYYRTDSLVDRFLSSLAGVGGLSLLYIAQQIYVAANFVLEKAISAPMVPLLAKKASAGEWVSFRESFRRRLMWMGLLTITAYGVFYFAGEWILTFLIGYGGVSKDNVRTLWIIMVALGGFLIGGAMGQITVTTFYAMGDTRTPTRLSVISYTIYVPFKVLAFLRYGLIGLAIVTTVYYLLNLSIQVILLEGFVLRSGVRAHSIWAEGSNKFQVPPA